ncbi:MAG: 50S ribosomal protein L9 [Deltaproteobacteria bacterium]|jgi:large subunit ribosomal protein L9|nr:50S ribosomal protein L9 [Deltaproteobacteria bacterium]
MEIILTRDVPNLGMAGQVLKVSPGFARNYLLPGSHALPATANNLKALAKKRNEFEARSREVKDEALILKKRLDSLVITIMRKSLEKGKLYGAVTPQDIVDTAALEGVILDRKRLKITEPIKALGDYDISVRLHTDVQGSFKLKVIAEPIPEPPAPAPETKPEKRTRRPRKDGPAPGAKASGTGKADPKAKPASSEAPAPAEQKELQPIATDTPQDPQGEKETS